MKAKLLDGSIKDVGGGTTGFVAEELILGPADVSRLLNTLNRDPRLLRGYLQQILSRFPQNRVQSGIIDDSDLEPDLRQGEGET